jgi:hypothetical protein
MLKGQAVDDIPLLVLGVDTVAEIDDSCPDIARQQVPRSKYYGFPKRFEVFKLLAFGIEAFVNAVAKVQEISSQMT